MLIFTKKQSIYKPSSVLFIRRAFVIYLSCVSPRQVSPFDCIVLPSNLDEQSSKRWFTWTFNSQDAQHVCCHTSGRLLPYLLTLTL